MNKRFMVIVAAVIAVFLGVLVFSKDSGDGGNTAGLSDHVEGKGKTGVRLIEYGDFECPACGAYFPLVRQLRQKYSKDIFFQFRNFPLFQIHQNAMAAHRAAEAAGIQHQFWAMHDLLYSHQSDWKDSKNPVTFFKDYAADLSLNIDKFVKDMNSQAVSDVINNDIQAGKNAGAEGTPTFVLDGHKLDPTPTDIKAFEKVIDDAIKAHKRQ